MKENGSGCFFLNTVYLIKSFVFELSYILHVYLVILFFLSSDALSHDAEGFYVSLW